MRNIYLIWPFTAWQVILAGQDLVFELGFDSLSLSRQYLSRNIISGNKKVVGCRAISSVDLYHLDTRVKPGVKGAPNTFDGKGMVGIVNFSTEAEFYREFIYIPFDKKLKAAQPYTLELAAHQDIFEARYWYPEIQYKLVTGTPNLHYAFPGEPDGVIHLSSYEKKEDVDWQLYEARFVPTEAYIGILIGVMTVEEKKVKKGFAGKHGLPASYLYVDKISLKAVSASHPNRVYGNQ